MFSDESDPNQGEMGAREAHWTKGDLSARYRASPKWAARKKKKKRERAAAQVGSKVSSPWH